MPTIASQIRMTVPLACSIMLAGCATEKESLYEHDHHEPEHWPHSISEAADFIESRVANFASGNVEEKQLSLLHDELADLVGWAPEIAADTDLSEADWLPIYELSEAMRRQLNAGDDPVEIESEFGRLIELLRDAESKLPAPVSDEPLSDDALSDESQSGESQSGESLSVDSAALQDDP